MTSAAGWLRVRTMTSVVIVASLVGALAVSSWGHRGATSSQLDLNPGTAWFADAASGRASLLDGATASRISEQQVARPGDDIALVESGTQSNSGAYVVDHTTGTVTRMDGATLLPERPVPFSPAGDGRLAVASDDHATWVIRQAGTLAQQVDPATLAPLGPAQPFSGQGPIPVETQDGSLWTVGSGGYIYSYAAGVARTRTHPASGRFTLVEADSRPVAADTTTGQAVILDPQRGRPTRTLPFNPPGIDPIVTGSGSGPYLASVDAAEAELQITDLNSRRSSGTVVIGNPDSDYGPAVVSGNLVFVPNLAEGAVVVAEIEHDQLTLLGQIPVDDRHFNLLSSNSSVWFDDPSNDVAGVIATDLTAWMIPKTGGTGVGKQVGHLGPIHLGDGSTLTAHAPPKNSTPLVTVHPIHPSAVPTQAVGSATPPNPGGNASPASTSVAAAPVPSFVWTPAAPHVDQAVTFTDTTTGPHSIFKWTFAGGSPPVSTGKSPTVAWPLPGDYAASLVVTENGSSYPVQQQVHITASGSATTTTTIRARPATPSTPSRTNTTTTIRRAATTTTTRLATTTTSTTIPRCNNSTVTVKGTDSPDTVSVTVPPGCTRASFDIQGAIGGAGGLVGGGTFNTGGGAEITITGYAVAAGQQFFLGAGSAGSSANGNQPGQGGVNPSGIPGDGGNGGCGTSAAGGGGGGESVVLRGNSATGTPLAIAAGAGAGGANGRGGDSGKAGNGTSASGPGGQPGTATAGGAGGDPAGNGSAGTGGAGSANAVCSLNQFGGGGGGAGRFGGGGGSSGGSGGGGGSDFVDPSITSGVTITDGGFFTSLPNAVTVTWS
jgi:hypothetical protein